MSTIELVVDEGRTRKLHRAMFITRDDLQAILRLAGAPLVDQLGLDEVMKLLGQGVSPTD